MRRIVLTLALLVGAAGMAAANTMPNVGCLTTGCTPMSSTVTVGSVAIGSALAGVGTTLQTSATTAYWYPIGLLASTTTEGNAEIGAPQTITYTHMACAFSAAQGSAKSDAITFTDVTNACATAITCTATNATFCAGTGVCAVTAGDVITIADVTTGASITARNGDCIVSP